MKAPFHLAFLALLVNLGNFKNEAISFSGKDKFAKDQTRRGRWVQSHRHILASQNFRFFWSFVRNRDTKVVEIRLNFQSSVETGQHVSYERSNLTAIPLVFAHDFTNLFQVLFCTTCEEMTRTLVNFHRISKALHEDNSQKPDLFRWQCHRKLFWIIYTF